MTRGQVDVSVGHAKGVRFPCPEYGQELAVYEHSAEQPWAATGQLPVDDLPARWPGANTCGLITQGIYPMQHMTALTRSSGKI